MPIQTQPFHLSMLQALLLKILRGVESKKAPEGAFLFCRAVTRVGRSVQYMSGL